MTQVILASGSPYRKELLNRLLNEFRCISPEIEEDDFKKPGRSPEAVAQVLARAKAETVAAAEPESIVIGSDQVADLNGRILGKPKTFENACEQLRQMSGNTHQLVTAVCLCFGDQRIEFSCITSLVMRSLNPEEIHRYVSKDMPLDCAGSYRIEAAGISLFERVETDDFTSIIGLPLIQLTSELRRLGVAIP